MFMYCYQDDSRQNVSSITQFSVGFYTILFPLNFKYFSQYWNLWKKKSEYHLINIILDFNILDRAFEVNFQVRIVKGGAITWTFCCVQYTPEHARMKLTYFIYLQLTIH